MLPIVDTHQHLWDLEVVRPPWLKDGNPLASLALRHIGPAITSGRISDFAFHPERKHEFFVATASGNLWKTENNAITWTPLFESDRVLRKCSLSSPSAPRRAAPRLRFA